MLDKTKQSLKNIAFKNNIVAGLSQTPKTISSEWFYDSIGSSLFDVITLLPEYYPTRTETSIFLSNIFDITKKMGSEVELVEYGSGSSEKTRLLFDNHHGILRYIPVEISESYLTSSIERLRQDYPELSFLPKQGSFLDDYVFPPTLHNARRVGFFPGSTIGNLRDYQIDQFFKITRDNLGDGAALIIGIDLKKAGEIIVPAYNDKLGVTAAFNLNVLNRINRELGSNFDLSHFRHEAIWNETQSRIEMLLISQYEHIINIDSHAFHFNKGESVLTEISRKFPIGHLDNLAQNHGWKTTHSWQDKNKWFQIILFEAN